VQKQGPHQNGVATKNGTRNCAFLRAILNLGVRKNSISMGAWNYSKGTVLFSTIVQMNSDGEHLFENPKGRPNMNYTGFARPWAPALNIELFANGNHAVLMPGYLPVRFWVFVEEDSPNREAFFAKQRRNRPPDLIGSRDGSYKLVGKEVANSMLFGVK
jgi:hypothetical protein